MAESRKMPAFTPREVVSELDRYIVGQNAAKRAVAIALRNRWRRQRVSDDLRDEIYPKNIIMIGPTGVGKTEIARRLAKLAQAPFVKVEASKFTEVGYVGRDVESMVRDLVEAAISLVREEETEKVKPRALELAEDRLMELLSGHVPKPPPPPPFGFTPPPGRRRRAAWESSSARSSAPSFARARSMTSTSRWRRPTATPCSCATSRAMGWRRLASTCRISSRTCRA